MSKEMLKERKDGQRAEEASSTLQKVVVYSIIGWMKITTCLMFFSLLSLGHFLTTLSFSFSHCHSLSLIRSLSLCNQIGLSYTPTAL